MSVSKHFKDMSARDVHSTYVGTYLRFSSRDDDGWYPALVQNFHSNNNIIIEITKLNGDTVALDLDDPSVNVNFNWPKFGMINVRDHVVYTERVAKRQWKKGLRMQCVNSQVHDEALCNIMRDEKNYARSFTDKDLNSLYDNTFTPIGDAIDMVVSGEKIARALSLDFAISNMYGLNDTVLMYKSNPVGVVNGTNVEIHEGLDHLIPMLKRIVPNGYHNSIVVCN